MSHGGPSKPISQHLCSGECPPRPRTLPLCPRPRGIRSGFSRECLLFSPGTSVLYPCPPHPTPPRPGCSPHLLPPPAPGTPQHPPRPEQRVQEHRRPGVHCGHGHSPQLTGSPQESPAAALLEPGRASVTLNHRDRLSPGSGSWKPEARDQGGLQGWFLRGPEGAAPLGLPVLAPFWLSSAPQGQVTCVCPSVTWPSLCLGSPSKDTRPRTRASPARGPQLSNSVC